MRKFYCQIDILQRSRNITKSITNRQEITQYSLLVVLRCVQPVFILIDVYNKQITVAENIRPQRREDIVSGDRSYFYRAVALKRDETGDEKYEEISRSSCSLFQKNPKVFALTLSSTAKVKKKKKKKITVSPTLKFSTMIFSADLTD